MMDGLPQCTLREQLFLLPQKAFSPIRVVTKIFLISRCYFFQIYDSRKKGVRGLLSEME